MIEVYYRAPADEQREKLVETQVVALGGRLTFREEDGHRITLTAEFDKRDAAEAAMRLLSTGDVHVEGPSDY